MTAHMQCNGVVDVDTLPTIATRCCVANDDDGACGADDECCGDFVCGDFVSPSALRMTMRASLATAASVR